MIENWLKKISWTVTVLFILGLIFLFAIQTLLFFGSFLESRPDLKALAGEKRVGVVRISGAIFEVQEILDQLERLEKRKDIASVLVEVNSPGGMVGPSQELSAAVRKISEAGKPVVASVRSVGASGGYYVASSADTVVVNPGSLIGSIGVIMEFIRVEDMIEKIGIDYEVIKSGRFKDLGSPFREMSSEEREVIRTLILDVYDQFINHVASRRAGLSTSQVENLADGRVFTGRQALQEGLVDVIGTRRQALELAAHAAGVAGDPVVVDFSRTRGGFFERFSRIFSFLPSLARGDERGFRLLYMLPGRGEKID